MNTNNKTNTLKKYGLESQFWLGHTTPHQATTRQHIGNIMKYIKRDQFTPGKKEVGNDYIILYCIFNTQIGIIRKPDMLRMIEYTYLDRNEEKTFLQFLNIAQLGTFFSFQFIL